MAFIEHEVYKQKYSRLMPCLSCVQNDFGQVRIVLVGSKLFWSGPHYFGLVQIRLFITNFYNLYLSIMIWTWPIQIGPDQNSWYSTKMRWKVQNDFGPIEGQNIRLINFLGSSISSYMVVDHPITMVFLIFICLFGITNTSKGASFTEETNKFVELLTNWFLLSVVNT